MGSVIDFKSAEHRTTPGGAQVSTILGQPQSSEMAVSLIRLSAGSRYDGAVPAGSDQYLFAISGAARLDGTHSLAPQSWAILEEGKTFGVTGGPAQILSVIVPPPGAGRGGAGFSDGLKLLAVKDLPIIDLPEEKKRRTYLANKAIAGSERGHAMIVRYTGETLTKKHHHPNAESLFVILTGRVKFLVDGVERVVGAGETAFFPMNDSHGLKSADGQELSFLEFHIPGAFRTEYDE
jgi:mannose-6-phosphate isomerase-like protein (cupin superfamily)